MMLDGWQRENLEKAQNCTQNAQFTKDEVIAMLTEIQLEIMELPVHVVSNNGSIIRMEIAPSAEDVYDIIQQKINALKADTEDQDGQTSN